MITWQDKAIILSRRPHGERDLVISVLTAGHGRYAALVKGGASRKRAGLIMAGNIVSITWKARLEEHLGQAVLESEEAHAAAVLDDFGRLSALNAFTALLDHCLPERLHLPGLFDHAAAFLTILSSSMTDETIWAKAYVQWEAALLADLGFGLDLSCCASTGQEDDLAYVSPKSGRAVSREAGRPWADRMFALPSFLIDPQAAGPAADIVDGLDLMAFFLERQVLADRPKGIPDARLRLRERFLT